MPTFLDFNYNGIQDSGEPSPNVQTGLFEGLPAGTYRVATPVALAPDTPRFFDVSVTGDQIATVSFTPTTPGSITGVEFYDLNGDGIFDAGDTAFIPGTIVYLDLNNNGSLDAGEPSYTQPSSVYATSYSFGNLSPETDYVVRVIPPAGFTVSVPSLAAQTVTLFNGQHRSGINFGLTTTTPLATAAVTGHIFDDTDPNNPVPLASWQVSIDVNRDGIPDFVTTSDASGAYTLSNIPPGTYVVGETLQSNYTASSRNNPNRAYVLTLYGGETYRTDFYNEKQTAPATGNIVGAAYLDTNGNGVHDPGDNVTNTGNSFAFQLIPLAPGANPINESVAFSNGVGLFNWSHIPPGQYLIASASGISDPPGGRLIVTVLSGGTTGPVSIGVSIGANLGTISGVAFNDANGNGVQDPGETGVPNIIVRLSSYAANANFFPPTLTKPFLTTVTDSAGEYTFPNIPVAMYFVQDQLTLPGQSQTTAISSLPIINFPSTTTAGPSFGIRTVVPPILVDPPAAPSNLTATVASATMINLAWTDNSNNETEFVIETSPDGQIWSRLAALPANTTSYAADHLAPSSTYYFRVRAINSVARSAFATSSPATTPASDTSPVVVDDDGPYAAQSGYWWSSRVIPGFFGGDYLNDGNLAKSSSQVTFTPPLPVATTYAVYGRWPSRNDLATDLPIDIVTASGIKTVLVNETQNGGQWTHIGEFPLDPASAKLIVRNGAANLVVVDAFEFIATSSPTVQTTQTPPALIVDDDDPAVIYTGNWFPSQAGVGFNQSDFRNDGNQLKGNSSVRFALPIAAAGRYNVFARWPSINFGQASTSVPFDIVTSIGIVTVREDESQHTGLWVLLGEFELDPSTAAVIVRNAETSGIVLADAVGVAPA